MAVALTNRRTLISTLAFAALTAPSARAQTWAEAGPDLRGTPQNSVIIPAPAEPTGLLSSEVLELWPRGGVPGARGVRTHRVVLERGSPAAHDRAVMGVSRPMLEVFRPAEPNGAALIILPGGAYVRIAVDKEGASGAHRFNAAGATVFVLNYRLPSDGWAAGLDAPLQDLQRALRLLRHRAEEFGIDPGRIGVMGFSAGGHLAGAALTRFAAVTYPPVDTADAHSARPDFGALCYAVMDPIPYVRDVDTDGATPTPARVRAGAPPTFLMHAADDATVPVSATIAMFEALRGVGAPTELHIYQEGGHGFGFSLPPEQPASHWPAAFEAWARRLEYFT